MSWDVYLCRFSRHYDRVEEIPQDERLLVMGSLFDVQAAVSAVFPGTDWSNPSWGVHECQFGSIEFSVGRNDPVEGLMLHVRAGAPVVGGILQLCQRLSCQALDGNEGCFLDRVADPAAGLEKWRAYRDQVVGNSNPQ